MGTNRPQPNSPVIEQEDGSRQGFGRKEKYAALVGMLGSFYSSFAGSALNLAIPQMGDYFGMGASSVGWIVTVYMLFVAASVVPLGKLADTTGRRRILIIGTAMFCGMSVFAVFASQAWMILLTRAVQGISSAMVMASCMPIVISAFPQNRRGQAIGITTSGVYAGLALGPALGGFLTHTFSWRGIFVFAAVISAIALYAEVREIEKDEPEVGLKAFDLPGNVLFALSIGAIIYGFTAFNTSAYGQTAIVAGIALLVVFVFVERRAADPVIDVTLFARSPAFTLSNLTALFNYAGTFSIGYLTSIYLQVVMGYTAFAAGMILIIQPLFMTFFSTWAGRLSDRIAPYKLASFGMALCAAALLFFAMLQAATPVWVIAIVLAVAGVGIALFSPPNTNIIMSCVPPAQYGIANSVLSTMRTLGQSSGMAVITLVVSAVVGNISLYDAAPERLLRTIHIAFAVFCVLNAAGIFMSLERRKA